MIYSISNGILTIKVKSMGAELVSCQDKSGYEYIYQTTPLWLGQAINMFPNVAMIKDNYITVKGKKYPAGQHGFIKGIDFALARKGDNILSFVLKSGQATKKYLPYDFKLYINFQLNKNSLIQTFKVVNMDDEEMYFGLGTHTGYIALDGSYLDYSNNVSLMEIERKDMMYLTGRCKRYYLKDGKMILKSDTFNHGADILTGFNKKVVTLKNVNHSHAVKIDFTDFEYLGVWAPKDSQIVISIMPWCALPDEENTTHAFEEKMGNVRLNGNDTFVAKLKLTFDD